MRNLLQLTFIFVFLNIFNISNAQSGFIQEDTIVSKLSKCGGKADICINNVTTAQLAAASILINGKPYTGAITACKADTIFAYDFSIFSVATPPPYKLDSLTINGKFYGNKDFPTFAALADSLSKWDNFSDWVYNDQTKKMTGGSTKSTYTPMVISTTTIISTNKVGLNTGINGSGVKFSFDEGASKVVINIPSANEKDSVYIYVFCPKTAVLNEKIQVGKTAKFCVDKKDLPAGKILNLSNLTALSSSSPISATVTKGDSCVEVKGLKKGDQQIILVATGQSGATDTTIINVKVEGVLGTIGSHVYNASVYEGQKIKYCIPTDALLTAGDSILTVENFCPTQSGKDVKFTITGKSPCIEMEGLKAGGLDTACVVITNSKNQKDTTRIFARVVKECKDLIKQDSIVTFVADCGLKGQICLPELKPADSLKYTFLAAGELYIDDKVGCDFDTIIAYNYSIMLINGNLLPPPYTVDAWTINGSKKTGAFNTIADLVKLMNQWDPAGKWELDTVQQLIIGGVPSSKYSPINITNQTFLVESELGFNIGLNARGIALSFERGVREIVITDNTTGCIDTVKSFVSCLKPDEISETIEEGETDKVCIDITELFSNPATTVNIKNDNINTNVTFTIDPDKKCITYKGNKIGKDTAIVVACDNFKFCDTTFIYVDVVKKGTNPKNKIIFDTIVVDDTDKYCLDTTVLLAPPAKLKEVKTKSSNNFADFTFDNKTFCLTYKGIKATGTDTAFVYFCSTVKCDTFQAIVTVKPKPLPNDVVIDEIFVGVAKNYCLPKSKYPGVDFSKAPASVKNICPKTGSPLEFIVKPDTTCKGPDFFGYSITYIGLKVGKDTACVEVTDSAGKKGVLKVVVTVKPRTPYIITDKLPVAKKDTFCVDLAKLDFFGQIDTLYNFCPKGTGAKKFANFETIKDKKCQSGFAIVITGVEVGKDTACYQVKDKFGNVDTIRVFADVTAPIKQPKLVIDTVVVFQTKNYCIDFLSLGFPSIDTIFNACPANSGENVIFSISKNPCTTTNGTPGVSIIYTGVEIGVDTACWVIKDPTGKTDTIKMIVYVRAPKPSIKQDTIEIGETVVICPDFGEVDAVIDSVINECPAKSGKFTKVTFNKATNCFTFEGLTIGKDTVCAVVVDQFGLKDTTTIIVTVVPKGSLIKIIAVNDTVTIPKDKPFTIKVKGNDIVSDTGKTTIKLIPKANGGKGPNNGVVTSVDNATGSMVYMPNFDFCGKDTFTYEICLGTKCDTADVYITIECNPIDTGSLVIYNAFSPNEDDINNTFTIKGITNPTLKGNELIIYNRWGNEIYRKKDYDNSFNGIWNGQELPSGTYFYVLCLPDKSVKSGYLVLRR
jgi:gliding motility-associated-like protein